MKIELDVDDKELQDKILDVIMRILNYWNTHTDKETELNIFRMIHICIDDAEGKYHKR